LCFEAPSGCQLCSPQRGCQGFPPRTPCASQRFIIIDFCPLSQVVHCICAWLYGACETHGINTAITDLLAVAAESTSIASRCPPKSLHMYCLKCPRGPVCTISPPNRTKALPSLNAKGKTCMANPSVIHEMVAGAIVARMLSHA
jgi:hypothetical protein